MRAASGKDIADTQWLTVTMDNGLSFVVGGGWSLPPGYPNFSTTWIEMVGTEGVVMVDDSHRDVVVNTVAKGMQLPLSTMPGEFVEHTYAGPMAAETVIEPARWPPRRSTSSRRWRSTGRCWSRRST